MAGSRSAGFSNKLKFACCSILLLVLTSRLPAEEPVKNILIIGTSQVPVRENPNPDEAAVTKLPLYDIVEVLKEDQSYQRKWYQVRYTDYQRSTVSDTTGYIEVAPDLKDIIPTQVMQDAFLYLSIDPAVRVKIDLLDEKWSYTDEIFEQKLTEEGAEDEVIKEWYEIRCRIFIPYLAEGYILQGNTYFRAFSESDAIRRVKAVKKNPRWKDIFKEKVLGGFITEKMSRDMVRASWGEPRSIKKGTDQVWIYGTDAKPVQVTFVNGQVAEWDK
jgi:hypothetical protein